MKPEILELQDWISACAFRINPARNDELKRLATKLDMQIEFTDDQGFTICADPTTALIILPIGALNYLWCSTYLFLILYNEYVGAQQAGLNAWDTAQSVRASNAIELWTWAFNALSTDQIDFPDDAPHPTRDYQHGDDIHQTNELFLCALAWVIHHEQAHVYLQHQLGTNVLMQSQENEADAAAAAWIMSGVDSVLERQKRGTWSLDRLPGR